MTLILIGLGVVIGAVVIILLSKNNQQSIGEARTGLLGLFDKIKGLFSKK